MKLLRTLTIFVFILFLVPSISFGEPSVEELSEKGADAYKSKDYAKATDFFKRAYEKEEVPNLLFNIAKCYEKQKEWDRAVEYYQKFAVAPDVPKEFRERALKKIEKIEEARDAEEEAKRRAEEKQKKKDGKKVEHDTSPSPDENSVESAPDRTMGYLITGLGVALVGGGVAFGLTAQSAETEFKTSSTVAEKRDAQSAGRTMSLLSNGFYAAGALTSAVGIYLLFSASSEADVPVSAWFTPTGGGASVQFSF